MGELRALKLAILKFPQSPRARCVWPVVSRRLATLHKLKLAMPKGVHERNLWISVTVVHTVLILLFCVDFENGCYASETPNNDGHPDKNIAVYTCINNHGFHNGVVQLANDTVVFVESLYSYMPEGQMTETTADL